MSEPEIRVPAPGAETTAYFDRVSRAFSGSAAEPANIERQLSFTEPSRSLAIFDGDEVVGTAGAFTMRMAVPGADMASAGVTRVSVAPTHRRRGLLTRMMRRQLDDIHEAGEPLAAVYASEAPIYGRFGYGLATWGADLVLPRARAGLRQPVSDQGRVTEVTRERAGEILPGLHERLRCDRLGGVSRSDGYWGALLSDPELLRAGASEMSVAVHLDGTGRPDAFATYRLKMGWTGNDPSGAVRVGILLSAGLEGYAALWRHLTSIDLTIELLAFSRPVDEPLRDLLGDPRALRATVADQLWLRVVDAGAALAGRTYSVPGRVRIRVRDELCPWNDGTWLLEGGPDGAAAKKVPGDGELMLTAEELGAAYLGGNRVRSLAWSGRVAGEPSAIDRLDAMLAQPLAPWCSTHF